MRSLEQFMTGVLQSCWGVEGDRSVVSGGLETQLALHGLLRWAKDSGDSRFTHGF